MDREVWRRAAYRILHPAPWLLTVLSLVSFPLTFYFLWSGDSSSWIACTVYSLAAYSLTALCVGLPGAIAHLRTSVHESRLVRRLGNTETARRMANDGDFRRSAVMLRGIAANAVYAAFRVFTGLAAVVGMVFVDSILLCCTRRIKSMRCGVLPPCGGTQ